MDHKHIYQNFFAQMVPLGAQLLVFVVLARFLNPAGMGVWSFYLVLHFFLESLRTSFIHNGFIGFVRKQTDTFPAIYGSAWMVQLAATLVMAIAFTVGVPFLANTWGMPELTSLAKGYVWVAIASGFYQMMQTTQTSRLNFGAIRNGAIVFSVGFLCSVCILAFTQGKGKVSLPTLQLAHVLCFAIGGLVMSGMDKSLLQAKPSWEMTGKLVHFGKFSAGAGISSLLYQKIDLLLIGWYMNAAAVGTYSVATRINNYVEMPLGVVAQVAYPTMAAEGDKGIAPDAIYKPLAWMLAVMLPACISTLLLAPWIVAALAGPDYTGAVTTLRIFALMALVKPFGRVFGVALDALGKPSLNFAIVFVSLLLNALLNVLMIPLLGLEGAAYATLISTWLSIIAGRFLLRKIFKIDYIVLLQFVKQVYAQIFSTFKQYIRYGFSFW